MSIFSKPTKKDVKIIIGYAIYSILIVVAFLIGYYLLG